MDVNEHERLANITPRQIKVNEHERLANITPRQIKVNEHERLANITPRQIKVNEHERLANITPRYKLKKRNSTFIWSAISGYTDCPKVVVWTSGNDIAQDGGQSVYPDIALHISNYCVYCTEDKNLTHTI